MRTQHRIIKNTHIYKAKFMHNILLKKADNYHSHLMLNNRIIPLILKYSSDPIL